MTRFISEYRGQELPPTPTLGLGDRVAKLLAAVGVTERSWLRLKRWAWKTLTGKEVVVTCGCQQRKEKLNRWGRWLAKWK